MAEGKVYAAGPGDMTHGVASIEGGTSWSIGGGTTSVVDGGGLASPGVAGAMVTYRKIVVTVLARTHEALLALVGAAAANVVLPYRDITGNRKKTVKNVVWTELPQPYQANAPDDGGQVAKFSLRGEAMWGVSDTYALMIVDAEVTP